MEKDYKHDFNFQPIMKQAVGVKIVKPGLFYTKKHISIPSITSGDTLGATKITGRGAQTGPKNRPIWAKLDMDEEHRAIRVTVTEEYAENGYRGTVFPSGSVYFTTPSNLRDSLLPEGYYAPVEGTTDIFVLSEEI